VRFADLETEERGNFLHSLPVYVCFNYFIDYAICKLNYEWLNLLEIRSEMILCNPD